jgi:hypothetical protein
VRNGRIILVAAALSFFSTVVSASTLITWEFSGVISTPSRVADLDALYPVGTPFSLDVTFDPLAPRLDRPPGPYGLYNAITTATFHLGNTTTTDTGGYIAVNCHAIGQGCPGGGPGDPPNPWVEFLMFPSPFENPPLLPGAAATHVERIFTDYRDPNVAAGSIPTMPPGTGGGLFLGLGDPFFPTMSLGGRVDSIRAIDDVAVVPEPGSFLLLATGLAGLRARRRQIG